MPQFDTFTFFSQLFWVFLFFFLSYLTFSYYLLPVISIILKVRRRKLQIISSDENSLTDEKFLYIKSAINTIATASLLEVSNITNLDNLKNQFSALTNSSIKLQQNKFFQMSLLCGLSLCILSKKVVYKNTPKSQKGLKNLKKKKK